MADKEILKEFVERMTAAAADNIVSVILFGSAADGDFHPEYSDLNMLCFLHDASFPALTKIAPVMDWWRSRKHPPPQLLTAEELKTSADVFSIEFCDIKRRYRVLYGKDLLRDLVVPMTHHRAQLEYELREKLFLLRQHMLLAASDEKKLWEVMLHSVSSFSTLFRHVLIEMGEAGQLRSREAVAKLSSRLKFDDSAFLQLMDVRARHGDRWELRTKDVASRYLRAIEQVAAAVDTMQSSDRQGSGATREEL
jgi:hypothetical protein